MAYSQFSDQDPLTKGDVTEITYLLHSRDSESRNTSENNPFIDLSVSEYWSKVYEKCGYECRNHFDPQFTWTQNEEDIVLRKLGYRVTLLACFMFVGLQVARGNLVQAISDNMLEELNLTTSDYNLSNSLAKIAFLLAEIPSSIICKKVGPDIWLPFQMIAWSIVATLQGFVKGRKSFLFARTLVSLLEGGFIPEMILWLSYFFTSKELGFKLAYFWSTSAATQCLCGILAFFLLRLRGVLGLSGWRWLFIIEGFITLLIGIISYFLIASSVVETKSYMFPDGWFTHREEKIVVNRVLRDDPSKGDMHNRDAISLKLLWDAFKDFDLWPVYLLGLIAFVPFNTVSNYFTLNLKEVGFSTLDVNLLTIPYNIFHIVTLLGITKLSERLRSCFLVELISPLWVLPGLAYLAWGEPQSNPRAMFWVTTYTLSQPYIHCLNSSSISRNSNSVKTRSISSALYNMWNQGGGVIAAYVYRSDDSPLYRRGNQQLFWLSGFTFIYILLVKGYYMFRNDQKDKGWNELGFSEREFYIHHTQDEGNKRLDFRFAH